ncbi:hypothetical protein J4Q44_G00072600 [Coregonus suidteri]|uniref:Small monomeric GTPase n=1 Tax=Coregonus suidteri TaxID=861788 RepID=A0AAN8M0R0_9TELE
MVEAINPSTQRHILNVTERPLLNKERHYRNGMMQSSEGVRERIQHYALEWTDTCCRGIRSAHVYILVYDICCFDSFEYVKTMRQQILETRVVGTGDTPILIVGNKRDLQWGRVIPRHNVSDLVRKNWKCGYMECSAKYNWHVLLLFGEAMRSVVCARCKHAHATIRFQRALRNERCALM